jgi:subtilisin family serine protease
LDSNFRQTPGLDFHLNTGTMAAVTKMHGHCFKIRSGSVKHGRSKCWYQAIVIGLLWIGGFSAGQGTVGEASAGAENELPSAEAADPVDRRGRPLYRPGELLVEFTDQPSETEVRSLHSRAGGAVINRARKGRLHRVRFTDSRAALKAMQRYREDSRVVHVERHALRYPQASPDDPKLVDQWALDRIAAPAGWNFSTGGDDMVIAVIDSGIDYLHPDLAANIWVNVAERDGIADVDDDGNGYVDDVIGWDFAGALFDIEDPDADPMDGATTGHGTHVAGIIAAAGNNGEGIAGLCWNARIMPLKVKADNAEDYGTFEVIEAIDYAVGQNVRIVNCSFGGTTSSDLEYQALERLHQAGGIAVCAAGNGGSDLDQSNFVYPACYDLPHIIAVAAAARNDTLAGFSNWGRVSADVMAPGESILSTVPAAFETYVVAGQTRYGAIGMLYAGTTGAAGIEGPLVDCAEGYPEDFPPGRQDYVALVWRSDAMVNFYFSQKVSNAQAAGAAAVIIANNRVDDLDRDGGTLGAPDDWPPVVTVTQEVGNVLSQMTGQFVTVIHRLDDTPSAAYGNNQGTSMATPHVAGLAGLIWSRNPALGAVQVKEAILAGVDRIDAVSSKIASGGRINAQKALCVASKVHGDLNCDGQTSLADAVLAGQLLSKRNVFACRPCLLAGTDPLADGVVSPADMIVILQLLAE